MMNRKFLSCVVSACLVLLFCFAGCSSEAPRQSRGLTGADQSLGGGSAKALRIRDIVRMKNEASGEVVGMGLVVGLEGTGDGGEFLPTARRLAELMKHFGGAVLNEAELKNANDVALVTLSVAIPPAGARAGDRLDVQVSALAAKSLKGGRLFIAPMCLPTTDQKTVLAFASGSLILPDDKTPTQGVIVGGGVLVEDVLPEEIKDNTFTLIIHPKLASCELATAIAEQINDAEKVDGKTVAVAVDATSVQVTIPQAERAHPAPFIARVLRLQLPNLD